MNKITKLIVNAVILMGVSAYGAMVKLEDGSILMGEVVKIHEGKMVLSTAFAGDIEIDQALIMGIVSDEPLSVRTQEGEVFKGTVATLDGENLTIRSQSGTVETPIESVASAWQPSSSDPIAKAETDALKNQVRKWSYEAGVDISGSSGNTKNLSTGLRFEAKLEGPDDRLRIYGSYLYAEKEGADGISEKTEDEQKVGANYTNFFSSHFGWYVREELERDFFEGIEFRSTTAAGLNYRVFKNERSELETRAGLSYRFEDYREGDSEDFPGLDFGLSYQLQFADWGKLVTEITYTPSVDDFGDYLIEHESGIDIPLALSDAWKLRLGMSNQYNSMPGNDRDRLDTSYFMRLILLWD